MIHEFCASDCSEYILQMWCVCCINAMSCRRVVGFTIKSVVIWILAFCDVQLIKSINARVSKDEDKGVHINVFALAHAQACVVVFSLLMGILIMYVNRLIKRHPQFVIVDSEECEAMHIDMQESSNKRECFSIYEDAQEDDNEPDAAIKYDTDTVSTRSKKSVLSLGPSTRSMSMVTFRNNTELADFFISIHVLGCVIWYSFIVIDFGMTLQCMCLFLGILLGHFRIMYIQSHTRNPFTQTLDVINMLAAIVIFIHNVVRVSSNSINDTSMVFMCLAAVVGTYWTLPYIKGNLYRDVSLAGYTWIIIVVVISAFIATMRGFDSLYENIVLLPLSLQITTLTVIPVLKFLTLLITTISIRQHETMDVVIITVNVISYVVPQLYHTDSSYMTQVFTIISIASVSTHVMSLIFEG